MISSEYDLNRRINQLMSICEQRHWPHFEWDESVPRPTLNAVQLLQGRVLGKTETVHG